MIGIAKRYVAVLLERRCLLQSSRRSMFAKLSQRMRCNRGSGNGMTRGTIAGILITDLVMGRSNPWKDLYDPSRKTLGAIKEFGTET